MGIVSWMDRLLEEQLARAAEAGELVPEPLKGKPIPGIDETRPAGWWADSLVRRERSADRRQDAIAAARAARVRFWRAETEDEVRQLVEAANADIATANINLIEPDRIEPFDVDDVVDRWRMIGRR